METGIDFVATEKKISFNMMDKPALPFSTISPCKYIQRIQVECLMVSVVAFVVTVELIALRGKMTDVARQE